MACRSGSAGSSSMPITASMRAFWKCIRFWAWGKIEAHRAVGDLVDDLFAAHRRQAVHELGLRLGVAPQPGVDLEGLEGLDAVLVLVLLAGPPPAVGVDEVGAGDGLERVVGEQERPAALGGELLRELDELGRHLVAGGVADAHVQPELGQRRGQRVARMSGVADVGERDAGERPGALQDRERVAHALAGVPVVVHAVDDRHRRPLGELVHGLVLLAADLDGGVVLRERARRVGDALAAGQVDLAGAQVQGVAAELGEAVLEADARARRGGLEDHRQVLAGEERRQGALLPEGFEVHGEPQKVLEFLARVVEVGEEVASAVLLEGGERGVQRGTSCGESLSRRGEPDSLFVRTDKCILATDAQAGKRW